MTQDSTTTQAPAKDEIASNTNQAKPQPLMAAQIPPTFHVSPIRGKQAGHQLKSNLSPHRPPFQPKIHQNFPQNPQIFQPQTFQQVVQPQAFQSQTFQSPNFQSQNLQLQNSHQQFQTHQPQVTHYSHTQTQDFHTQQIPQPTQNQVMPTQQIIQPLPTQQPQFQQHPQNQAPTQQWTQPTPTPMTMTPHTQSFITQPAQYPALTLPAQPSHITQNVLSVARIERPCYLYFVEFVQNQQTPTPQQNMQQQTTGYRYMPVTNTIGTQGSTFQF